MTVERFISARLDEVEETSGRPREAADVTSRPKPRAGVQELKLSRVQVMREVVAEHPCDRFVQICLTCRHGGSDEGWASEAWPCPTIRQIAALWADHPDYDTAWSPQERLQDEGAPIVPRQRRASNGVWLFEVPHTTFER